MENKIRYPQAGAAKEIQKSLNDILKKPPTEKLIRIINENNRLIDLEDQEDRKNDDRAARAPEAGL